VSIIYLLDQLKVIIA